MSSTLPPSHITCHAFITDHLVVLGTTEGKQHLKITTDIKIQFYMEKLSFESRYESSFISRNSAFNGYKPAQVGVSNKVWNFIIEWHNIYSIVFKSTSRWSHFHRRVI